MKITDTACGILFKSDGKLLLCQRRKPPYAGYWEFPGGKIERFELPEMAVRREIHEEIAVLPRVILPWQTCIHRDSHAMVSLHVFRILSWEGRPQPVEKQPMGWFSPFALPEPGLPANRIILQTLRLPPYCAFTAIAEYGLNIFLERLHHALQKGLKLVIFREKELPLSQLKSAYAAVARLVWSNKAKLLLSSFHLDSLPTTNTDPGPMGIHYTSSDLQKLGQRPGGLVSASCHNASDLNHALSLGLDFAVLSPVEKTTSHPEALPLGWVHFSALVKNLPLPVYALGGLSWNDLHWAMMHGAYGVAFRGAAWRL